MTVEVVTWHDMDLICTSSLLAISNSRIYYFLRVQ